VQLSVANYCTPDLTLQHSILNLNPSDSPVIELIDIHKNYGSLDVLKGVSLSAHRGEVIALIGSSGSGKSTLLRCINLLEIPAKGEISFQGTRVAWKSTRSGRVPADQRQVRQMRTHLSMVFQQFNLWSHMTILQNVTEAPVRVQSQPRDDAERTALELLDKVGIADKAHSYPSQLSGGQQQRAAMAMLFDEPTSALDPELEAEVIQVIKQLAYDGSTMIIVTHDMKLAMELADDVIFLHDGQIVEQGPPEQVFHQTQSERLKAFLSSTL